MTCVEYAKQRWEELTDKTWPASGSDGPTMYKNCLSSRKSSTISSDNLPAIVVYTNNSGSGNGHVGIIESYSNKKYTYSDANYDADLSGTIRPAIQCTASEIEDLFNSLSFKGIMF